MAPLVMSIDAGTTGITVLVVDGRGNLICRAYREFPQHFPRPGWVEHDPEQIWQAVEATMSEAQGRLGSGQVAAIGITNQRETTVVWDRSTLEPVYNAIVWQCRRSTPICDELRAAGHEEEVRRRTGLLLDPYFCGTKLTWLLRERPDLRRRAAAGELAFGTIDSWLLAKLTAGEVHATDLSNASRTLLFNIHDLQWDARLLDIFEVPEALLPAVQPSAHRFGHTHGRLLDGRRIPIHAAIGDQQAALFGQACFEPGMSKNTYGTGSFVLTNTGSRASISTHGMLTTIAWGLESRVTYAMEGSIFITGAAIQWLRDGLQIIESASDTEALAMSVDDTAGTYLVPAFVGLSAPHWDPDARGAIIGITRGTTRAHLARAAVESMAYQTRDVIDAMAADSGITLHELRVDGGAAVMDLLCQFQADLLGVAVVRPSISETTGMGAAYLAGLSAGIFSGTEQIARFWKAQDRFEPSLDGADIEKLYRGWLRAVGTVKTR